MNLKGLKSTSSNSTCARVFFFILISSATDHRATTVSSSNTTACSHARPRRARQLREAHYNQGGIIVIQVPKCQATAIWTLITINSCDQSKSDCDLCPAKKTYTELLQSPTTRATWNTWKVSTSEFIASGNRRRKSWIGEKSVGEWREHLLSGVLFMSQPLAMNDYNGNKSVLLQLCRSSFFPFKLEEITLRLKLTS